MMAQFEPDYEMMIVLIRNFDFELVPPENLNPV